MKEFYFTRFEQRQPYQSIPDNKLRELLFHFVSIITIVLGIAYLNWRWMYSLNPGVLWFAIPLVLAETLSFVGTILIVINFWANKDPKKEMPVHYLSDIEDLEGRPDRPIRIDVHIASYNEDVEIVRHSIRDAKKMKYPYNDVKINIYVLDDGKRDGRNPSMQNMKQIALEEEIGYIVREHNEGYKAGNLKNALEHTIGDLFVILDADTRPFPSFLENTTGYFRNRKLAWVQTPQWFYDTTEPIPLSKILIEKLRIKKSGKAGIYLRKIINVLFGKIKMGEDIFGNDPRLFYDVLLRRRNNYNAAFCCGAGSIHRREAIMSLAVRDFVHGVKEQIKKLEKKRKRNFKGYHIKDYKKATFLAQQVIPFKFHASEDIYTSIMLHADRENKWQSLQHPDVECKMLSPQDVDSLVKQRTRYASGSLDIAFKDNPLFKRGLTLGQRISYFNTIWSYFAPLWIVVFLLSPIIFFFFQSLPIQAYSFDFFKYFITFQIMNTITITIGCWGISTKRGDQYYISSFWLMLRSLYSALKREKVKFNVTPKDRQLGNYMQHILPHAIIIGLTVSGILYNIILIINDTHPSWSGFASNTLWGIFNIYNLSIMLRAASWKHDENTGIEI